MVQQRLQEEAVVWAGVRRAGSRLGLRFQSSEQKSVEGRRPKGTRAQLGFINAGNNVRMKPFKTTSAGRVRRSDSLPKYLG